MLADLSMDGVSLRELAVPGLDGAPDVVVRFFTPEHADGPLPVLVWIDPRRRIRHRDSRVQRSLLRGRRP